MNNYQSQLTDHQINNYLNFLSSVLPNPSEGLIFLPLPVISSTTFTKSSIQNISDYIGTFLGITDDGVKISLEEEYGSYNSSETGLYKVLNPRHSEILIVKKRRYHIGHVIAILAHEYTHHYLHLHDITLPEEYENEIFTDIAAVYLGLGHLLLLGYKPIEYKGNFKFYIIAYSYTEHKESIGYLKPNDIINAIVQSTFIRNWNPKDVITRLYFYNDKTIYFFKWLYHRFFRNIRNVKG